MRERREGGVSNGGEVYTLGGFRRMGDSVGEVGENVRTRRRRCYVRIITHESDFVPFEVTNADTLTQFFGDFNNVRTGVSLSMDCVLCFQWCAWELWIGIC